MIEGWTSGFIPAKVHVGSADGQKLVLIIEDITGCSSKRIDLDLAGAREIIRLIELAIKDIEQ